MVRFLRRGDPLDARMGSRLRERRTQLGWSQERLGQAVGVTFQMIQKYERGECRVSASRLLKIAQALDVSVSWFYQDAAGAGLAQSQPKAAVAEPVRNLDDSLLQRRETVELLKLFYALPEGLRRDVLDIMKNLINAQIIAVRDTAAAQSPPKTKTKKPKA